MRATCYAHGAVDADSGAAAVACVIVDEAGTERVRFSRRIGILSENAAMLYAARAALDEARDAGVSEVDLVIDSAFVVRALTGGGTLEEPGLTHIIDGLENLVHHFDELRVREVRPEENEAAVRLAREALAEPAEMPPSEPLPPATPPEDQPRPERG